MDRLKCAGYIVVMLAIQGRTYAKSVCSGKEVIIAVALNWREWDCLQCVYRLYAPMHNTKLCNQV